MGVSNTADTLNFINNMNTNKYIVWCSAWIVIYIGILTIILDIDICKNNTSSPVEGMYHRQLVATLDSIFNARFSSNCYEEVIDSDDVSVPQQFFSSEKFVNTAK